MEAKLVQHELARLRDEDRLARLEQHERRYGREDKHVVAMGKLSPLPVLAPLRLCRRPLAGRLPWEPEDEGALVGDVLVLLEFLQVHGPVLGMPAAELSSESVLRWLLDRQIGPEWASAFVRVANVVLDLYDYSRPTPLDTLVKASRDLASASTWWTGLRCRRGAMRAGVDRRRRRCDHPPGRDGVDTRWRTS